MRTRLALAAVCVAVAALALTLARDAWLWDKAIRDADERAQVMPLGSSSWDAGTLLPGDPARSLLDIDDDLDFRRLYARAYLVAASPPPSGARSPRPLVETALGQLTRTEEDQRIASAAANLLGVLFFTDPDDPESSPAERAIGSFQDAVLLDPGNASAKANLELVLRQLATDEIKGRTSPGGGNKGGKGGAGLAPGGKGW